MGRSRSVRRRLAVVSAATVTALTVPPVAANAAVPAGVIGGSAATGTPAVAAGTVSFTSTEAIAPGVTYRTLEYHSTAGTSLGHLLTADLRNPMVSVDLLHPDSVAQRATVSAMTTAQRAVGGVNGDFFNISETHAGVEPTGSANGPEIADGRQLKAAVPNGQRFGPRLPPGTSTRDVLGVGVDRRARMDSVTLTGEARTRSGSFPLVGFNQYAVPVNGVGAYTADWGSVSRVRATCGTDTRRLDPCTARTYEVTIRRGVVTSVSRTPGAGVIAPDTVVLVGREDGADRLDDLVPGDRVQVREGLTAAAQPPLTFAVGGYPILRDGQPLAGLDLDKAAAVRTAAGVSQDGRTVFLMTLDGLASASDPDGFAEAAPGSAVTEVRNEPLTIPALADLMAVLGADDAVNLDGGGSSTLAVRGPGEATAVTRNHPSGTAERPVANGVGIFVGPTTGPR